MPLLSEWTSVVYVVSLATPATNGCIAVYVLATRENNVGFVVNKLLCYLSSNPFFILRIAEKKNRFENVFLSDLLDS